MFLVSRLGGFLIACTIAAVPITCIYARNYQYLQTRKKPHHNLKFNFDLMGFDPNGKRPYIVKPLENDDQNQIIKRAGSEGVNQVFGF